MTTPATMPPPAQDGNGFWTIRLTRTTACLMSLFGPVLLMLPLMLFISVTNALSDRGGADIGGLTVILVFLFAVAGMRFSFARWYARDKGRNGVWGIAGLFGFWGWIVLWSLADLSRPKQQGQIA